MKKIFALISALLIFTVGFTNEAKAETKQDNTEVVFEYSFDVIPTSVDNVVVLGVKNVVAFVTSYIEVGGSIVSSDANLPDQDNYAISNSKVNYGLWLLSKRKYKTYIASNDNFNSVKNDKVGDIVSNVGKLKETYII